MIFPVVLAVLLGLAQSTPCEDPCEEPCEEPCGEPCVKPAPYPKCCPELICEIEKIWESCGKPDLCSLEPNSPHYVAKGTCGLTTGLGLPATPKCIDISYSCNTADYLFFYEDCSTSENCIQFVVDECDPIISNADGSTISYFIAQEGSCSLKYICSPEGEEGGDCQGDIVCSKSCCDNCAAVEAMTVKGEELGLCFDIIYPEECRTC